MTRFLTVIAMVAAVMLTSCKKEQAEKTCCSQEKAVVEQKSCCSEQKTTDVLTPENILANGAELIDQEIQIEGTVTHICKHGGKKCSIMGATPEAFVQVMAGEQIGSFPTEVMGSNILVKGIVKENRITKEFIAEREAAMQTEAAEKSEAHEGKHQHCSHSTSSRFDDMKKWMEENGKDYFPIYFIQGVSYEVVE